MFHPFNDVSCICKCKCFPFVRKEDSERGLSRKTVPSRGVLVERIAIFDLRELNGSILSAVCLHLDWCCALVYS